VGGVASAALSILAACGELPTTTQTLPIPPSAINLGSEALPSPLPTHTPLVLTPDLKRAWNISENQLVLLIQWQGKDLVAQLSSKEVSRWIAAENSWPGVEGIDVNLIVGDHRETATAQLRLGQPATFTFANPPVGQTIVQAKAFSGSTTLAQGEVLLSTTSSVTPLILTSQGIPTLQGIEGTVRPLTIESGVVRQPLVVGKPITLTGEYLDQVEEVLFAAPLSDLLTSDTRSIQPGTILEKSSTRLTVQPPAPLALDTTAVTVMNAEGKGLGTLDMTWQSAPPPLEKSAWTVQPIRISDNQVPDNGSLKHPRSVVGDPEGNLFIADQDRHQILRLSVEGVLQVWAGTGKVGKQNGSLTEAQFNQPTGLAWIKGSGLLVVDHGNHLIRLINAEGQVSTWAGSIAGFKDGARETAQFQNLTGLAVGSDGSVYVADSGNHRLRRISPKGEVTTVAGTGKAGLKDGKALEALLHYPVALTLDAENSIWFVDQNNHRIRKLTADGQVVSVTGGKEGFADGDLKVARFNLPSGIAWDPSGALLVADSLNHRIRKVIPEEGVRTWGGSDQAGLQNGSLAQALFTTPMGFWVQGDNSVVVVDAESTQLRKLIPIQAPSSL
jgi:sugar lactone lactonase YvrE